jgi:hypothetical protein
LKHTRKHERRRKESKQGTKLSASGHADRPAGGHGPSVKDNRTTRTDPRKTDRPRRPGAPSARVPDRPLLKLGPSANRLQRKPKTKSDRKQRRVRTHDEHATNSTRTDCPPTPRGLSAPHGQSRNLLDPEGQLSQSITGSPKR